MILDDPSRAAPFFQRRRETVAAMADWASWDAAWISSIKNIRYLSGFSGTSGGMLLTQSESWFVTDFRYVEQAGEETRGVNMQEAKEPLEGAASLLAKLGARSLAFEAEHVSAAALERMQRKLSGVRLVPVSGLAERARLIKDEAELEAIRRLVDMLGESIGMAKSMMKPGVSELDIAIEMERAIRLKGAAGPAFEFIVASGKRGALPHGVASSRKLERGDAVTLDWGARGWGYNSDNTRTFLSAGADRELREIYKIVLEANQAAMEAARPGVKLSQVDLAAREIIVRAGYGDRFGHGTGHGVGLDVHEGPKVNGLSEEVAAPGMVFTIEPGIYLPGKGGVRIEDMVCVTETGIINLSRAIEKSFEYALLD